MLRRNRSGVSAPLVDVSLPMNPFTHEASLAADQVKDAADQVAGLAGKTTALCGRAVEARGLQSLGSLRWLAWLSQEARSLEGALGSDAGGRAEAAGLCGRHAAAAQ